VGQVQNQHFLHQNHLAQQPAQSKDPPSRLGKKGPLNADEVLISPDLLLLLSSAHSEVTAQ